MLCRERRSWTAEEDQLLRDAVKIEDPNNSNPSKWHAISKHVPNRNNKDCRKRWFAKMVSNVVKGGWTPEEDEKLLQGIDKYGTRWSLVAAFVKSRNSDQCAKRWRDTLDPSIDWTAWTPEADEILLQAVNEHGKVWTKIVKTYFPGRTGLSAKNRYNSIVRFNSHHRGVRSRRKIPDLFLDLSRRDSEGASSSSPSPSVSPTTPSLIIPATSLPHSGFDSMSERYLIDTLANWAQTPSPIEASSEWVSFLTNDDKEENISTRRLPSSSAEEFTQSLGMNSGGSHMLCCPFQSHPCSHSTSCDAFLSEKACDASLEMPIAGLLGDDISSLMTLFNSIQSDGASLAPAVQLNGSNLGGQEHIKTDELLGSFDIHCGTLRR